MDGGERQGLESTISFVSDLAREYERRRVIVWENMFAVLPQCGWNLTANGFNGRQ